MRAASTPESDGSSEKSALLPRKQAVLVFLSFAFAYFLSALVRAVTATLAPQFSVELHLSSGDLGLLAGAYFLGFASMQLPLGSALDRHGARRVLLVLLTAAVIGCIAFATATSFVGLILARTLIGMGVAACLMAPLTTYRHRFTANAQMRANSWMLMTGSLGMVTRTVSVRSHMTHRALATPRCCGTRPSCDSRPLASSCTAE
jgi:MFS family permease